MATRSNIHFDQRGTTYANVYVHYDGYPENRVPELNEFLADVKAKCKDTRFSDAEYLAAKFIVWYADKVKRDNNLDFLGIGVCTEDHGDIDYIYTVDCTAGEPTIAYKKAE